MVLLIDNFDSFTYNLAQYFRIAGEKVITRRNDVLDTKWIEENNPDLVVISPGPGGPSSAGLCKTVIEKVEGRVPLFGVCLGLQVIADYYGGQVSRAIEPMHGKVRRISHDGKGLFAGLPTPLSVTRYHSLVVEKSGLPDCIEISATSDEGEIMAIRHKRFSIEAVQFHPEALLTERGMQMIENVVNNLRQAEGAAFR